MGIELGTSDFRETYIVILYGLLLDVYGLPTYVSVMVRNHSSNLFFKVVLVAASYRWPAKLHICDGQESNRGYQI